MATLDKSKPYGECHGGAARYVQDGVHFDGSGNAIWMFDGHGKEIVAEAILIDPRDPVLKHDKKPGKA